MNTPIILDGTAQHNLAVYGTKPSFYIDAETTRNSLLDLAETALYEDEVTPSRKILETKSDAWLAKFAANGNHESLEVVPAFNEDDEIDGGHFSSFGELIVDGDQE